MRRRDLGSLALLCALAGCWHRAATDRAEGDVTAVVRAAYGSSIRSVAAIFPSRVQQVPLCPWDAGGAPDAGFVLVFEDRQVGERDALLMARRVCRRAVPTRLSGPFGTGLERFELERRGGIWLITRREVLEERFQ